jgi:hypothetical protein
MVGSSNVPTFRIIIPGLVPGSSAIDEPHSGQKCLRIGLPLPPMLLNVLSVPSIVTAFLVARTSAAKALPVNFWQSRQWQHRRARRIGLGCIAHRAAEAAAFDLHLDPLLSYPFGSWRMNAADTWSPPYGQDQLYG